MKTYKVLNIKIRCTSKNSPYDIPKTVSEPKDAIKDHHVMAAPVKFSDWKILYWLVMVKKGSMDGDSVERYLMELFQVGDLRLASKHDVRCAIDMLSDMPDKLQD